MLHPVRFSETARVRLTRAGRRGLFAILAVAAAAMNTANNLLYLCLALLLVLYPLSWFLARASLRRVRAGVMLPRALRAGTPSAAVVRLEHARGRLGSPALAVRLQAGEKAGRAVCPWLERGGEFVGEVPLRPERRGPWPVRAVLLCPFPFGLMEARRAGEEAELVVLPALLPGWREPAGGAGRKGEEMTHHKGRGVDLLHIREYQAGEDARFLDWKATARLQRPMYREHAREAEHRAAVIVDPGLPPGLPPEEGAAEVERAISRAAGALEGLSSRGWTLRLITPEGVVGDSVTAQMEHLARLEVRPEPAGRFWGSRIVPGEPWLLFTAGRRLEEGAA